MVTYWQRVSWNWQTPRPSPIPRLEERAPWRLGAWAPHGDCWPLHCASARYRHRHRLPSRSVSSEEYGTVGHDATALTPIRPSTMKQRAQLNVNSNVLSQCRGERQREGKGRVSPPRDRAASAGQRGPGGQATVTFHTRIKAMDSQIILDSNVSIGSSWVINASVARNTYYHSV